MKPIFLIHMAHADRDQTVISVFKQGEGRMEFRSNGIWQWGFGMEHMPPGRDHISNHGTVISWAEWLHNGLMGMHTCILYTDDEFCVHDRHEDYGFVSRLWDLGLTSDREVLATTGGVI
jgi:hypothetical protein